MMERFSAPVRDAVTRAYEDARSHGDGRIEATHLLASLLEQPGAVIAPLLPAGLTAAALREQSGMAPTDPLVGIDADALKTIGIDLEDIRARLREQYGDLPAPLPKRPRGFRLRMSKTSPAAKKALEWSVREAVLRHSQEIRPEYLMLGVLRTEDPGVREALAPFVDPAELRAAISAALDTAA